MGFEDENGFQIPSFLRNILSLHKRRSPFTLHIIDAFEGSKIVSPAPKFSESAHAYQPRMQSVLLIIYKNASDLGLIASQRTAPRPRKPLQPGSDPGRSSLTSTSHRTRESARRRPSSFADSQPPKITPRAALFSYAIRVRRKATPVDRGRRRRGREVLSLRVQQRAMNPPDKTRNGRPGRNRPRSFLFGDLVRLSSPLPQ